MLAEWSGKKKRLRKMIRLMRRGARSACVRSVSARRPSSRRRRGLEADPGEPLRGQPAVGLEDGANVQPYILGFGRQNAAQLLRLRIREQGPACRQIAG